MAGRRRVQITATSGTTHATLVVSGRSRPNKTNTASAASDNPQPNHSPAGERRLGQSGAHRQRGNNRQTQGWAAPTQRAVCERQQLEDKRPATAARLPLPPTAVGGSNVKEHHRELTPCSWGTSMVGALTHPMPMQGYRGEDASSTVRPWPTKASRSFEATGHHTEQGTTHQLTPTPAVGFSTRFRTEPSGHTQQRNAEVDHWVGSGSR